MSAPAERGAARPAYVATLVVTVLVLGPLYVHGGIALRGDMVFTPDQPWKPGGLGLDGAVPRAVPMDALIAMADEVLPGPLLQRALLTAALLAGGWGIARLGARFHSVAQVAAVVVYLWNPWVYERLAIGQWPTVLGYGLLPWLVLAVERLCHGRAGGWARLTVLLLLSAVCAPSVGLLAALVALILVTAHGEWARALATTGLAAVANLPWLVPAVLGPQLHGSGAQFGDFSARGESALGTFASLLSMGGIWKTSIVPPERTHVVVVAVAALVSVACAGGLRSARSAVGPCATKGVAAAGGLSLLLALVPSIGPMGRALGSLSEAWPPAGMLRDSHRFLAPLGLVLALGAAALVDRMLHAARSGQPALRAIVAVVLLAPPLLLPSLVWGLSGGLTPVSYPADWARAAARVDAASGATVVLPWTGSYRGYAWNGYRAVLDPAPRFLPGDVLIDDRHFLGAHHVLPSEDPYLARIAVALHGSDPAEALARLGVRWVLVEKANGVSATDVPRGRVVYDGRWLRLVDLGRPTEDLRHLRPGPPAPMVVAGDVLAGFVGCVSVVRITRLRLRTCR